MHDTNLQVCLCYQISLYNYLFMSLTTPWQAIETIYIWLYELVKLDLYYLYTTIVINSKSVYNDLLTKSLFFNNCLYILIVPCVHLLSIDGIC